MTCEFTYTHYLDTIHEHHDAKGRILIRHDIDFSLEKAVGFAKMEKDNGISGFYFILFDGQYYNPLTEMNMERLKIGLHYSSLGDTSTNIARLIHNKRETLETIIDYPVTMMARHNVVMGKQVDPAILEALKFIGLKDINKYLNEYKYISDSGMHWREGCMCKHIGKYDKLMILTHPIWWNERALKRGEVISKWHTHEGIKRQNVYNREMERLNIYDQKIKGI